MTQQHQQQHQQPAEAHDLLTITEAADLLRAPVATLRFWRHLGTGARSVRHVVYRTDDLHAWIERERGRQTGDSVGSES